jgi:hypothetical protein
MTLKLTNNGKSMKKGKDMAHHYLVCYTKPRGARQLNKTIACQSHSSSQANGIQPAPPFTGF